MATPDYMIFYNNANVRRSFVEGKVDEHARGHRDATRASFVNLSFLRKRFSVSRIDFVTSSIDRFSRSRTCTYNDAERSGASGERLSFKVSSTREFARTALKQWMDGVASIGSS